ncbi:MAG: ABC transporter ATP-binding protein [Lachnospiraceae bacterium]|nr:ABC transporter ATP-binding protein [Lachnospiraceae bacterium]
MSYILTTDGLTKQYKTLTAVDSVDLHVEEGAVYGLIGRNGAGKTTILKMLSGLAMPTAGEINYSEINGRKPRLGVLIEEPGLFTSLTALQNLEIKRIALGAPGSEKTSRDLLAAVGLFNWADVRCGSFSLGMRQRLSIALALCGDPDILILDEPVNGLDPQGIHDVRNVLRRLHEEMHKTIIISSHLLDELSKIATVYGVLDRGRLLKESTEEEIINSMPGYVRFIVDSVDKAKEVLEEMGIFSYQTKSLHTLHVLEQFGRRDEMVERMVVAGVHVHECLLIRESLEDYYMGITKEGIRS